MDYKDYQMFMKIRERANKIGLDFGGMPDYHPNENNIALKPKDDCLPIYSRDAIISHGDLSSISAFLVGVEWARGYDELMKVSSEKTREKREHDFRKTKMFKQLKDEAVDEIQN